MVGFITIISAIVGYAVAANLSIGWQFLVTIAVIWYATKKMDEVEGFFVFFYLIAMFSFLGGLLVGDVFAMLMYPEKFIAFKDSVVNFLKIKR